MTPRDRQLSAHSLAPMLLLAAVAIVILAQLWPVVPIAGAIGMAGWGTALAIPGQRARFLLALAVYVPLVTLAVAAQLDAASTKTLARQFFAAMDSGAAAGLMVLLARRV